MSSVTTETVPGVTPGDAKTMRYAAAARAAVCVASALVLAVTAHLHNVFFGWVFLTVFGCALAIALGVGLRVRDSRLRIYLVAHIFVALALGIQGVLAGFGSEAILLFVALCAWAVSSALVDFLFAWRHRSERFAIDLYTSAGFALAFAAAAFIPGADPAPLLGLFGGYLAIAGVFLGIAAASTDAASTAAASRQRGKITPETQS